VVQRHFSFNQSFGRILVHNENKRLGKVLQNPENQRDTTVKRKINRLIKISRICAWILLAGIIILTFSGWGITQTGIIYNATFGLIDRRTSDEIHRLVGGPMAAVLLSHIMTNIKLYFVRKNSQKGLLTNIILIVIAITLMAGVIYMQYIRKGG
jgi:hypothetical protein